MIQNQQEQIEQQTQKLEAEKERCNQELQKKKTDFLTFNQDQMIKIVDNQKKIAVKISKKIRCSNLQSRALRQGYGTDALGNVDNADDGDRTKRRRRKVIVLQQKRGMSLDLTLQESAELKNLGLTFDKWQVQSPVTSTQSAKHKKIILRRVDKPGEDSFEEAPFKAKSSKTQGQQNATNPEDELARSIMRKRMQQQQMQRQALSISPDTVTMNMQRSAVGQRTYQFEDSKGALSPINMSGILSPTNMFEWKGATGTNTNNDLDSVLDKMSGNTNVKMINNQDKQRQQTGLKIEANMRGATQDHQQPLTTKILKRGEMINFPVSPAATSLGQKSQIEAANQQSNNNIGSKGKQSSAG